MNRCAQNRCTLKRVSLPSLWRHSGFLRLWAGQSISVFGSVVGIAAMGFTAILFLHATPFQLGILSAARLLPGFLIGLAAGAWVDRLRRRPVLIAVDLGRAALLATIALAALFGTLRIEQLYAVTFLISLLTVFFDVAYQSYLPTLITREELTEGNSKLAATASVAEFGGFSVAGWLVERLTAPVTILIDAISFVVSALSVWWIRTPEPVPARSGHHDMRAEIAEGLRTIRNDRLLRSLAVCSLSKDFFIGIYGALVLLYMTRGLGFNPGVLGVIFAVGGVSSFFGAMATPALARRFGPARSMIAGLLLFGVSILFVPVAQGATVASAILLTGQQLIGDGAITIHMINQVSVRQKIAPEGMLGRVNATSEFLRLGSSLAGSLAGGLLGEFAGVRTALFFGAFGVMLSTLWLLPLGRPSEFKDFGGIGD